MPPKKIKRAKIVAGNWKMNGNKAFVADYQEAFETYIAQKGLGALQGVDIILIPPYVLLPFVGEIALKTEALSLQVGAQNVSGFDDGAYTGEVSAKMLKDMACEWCLVGHSERRSLFAEIESDIVNKIRRLLDVGLKPVLCLGETGEQRDEAMTESVVAAQLKSVLDAFDEQELSKLILAYEPVWAIGTGKTASPEQAQDVHRFIRGVLATKSERLADNMPILYGGSVTAENAQQLFEQEDIDGALVGGASLKVENFVAICVQCAGSC